LRGGANLQIRVLPAGGDLFLIGYAYQTPAKGFQKILGEEGGKEMEIKGL